MKTLLKHIVRKSGVERRHVALARMCCERHVLAAVGRSRKRWIGRILCYHSIGQPEWGPNNITPARFRRHIELALNAGYRFVPASEIARTGGGEKDLAITFDDGLRSVLTQAAPVLKEYGLPWTFFPVSEWSEGREPWMGEALLSWRDIETLLASGAEMGSHSATHPDFGKIVASQMADELGGSRDLFEKRLGFAPDMFAIPLGQSANWKAAAETLAREAGYKVLFAQAEDTRPAGTAPRTFITRFDGDRIFNAVLKGKFDRWEEWV
ncbi:MAG: polysaccharide deacetylase family protein [Alphaproteobacteria bacterium]